MSRSGISSSDESIVTVVCFLWLVQSADADETQLLVLSAVVFTPPTLPTPFYDSI